MRRIKLLTIIFLVLPLLASCISSNTSPVDNSNAPGAVQDDHAALAAIPRISAAEAASLVKQTQAVIIDVRAEAAYRSQHIQGSMSVPEGQVLARLATLPREKKIITYCT